MANNFTISTILKVLDQSTKPLQKIGSAWGKLSDNIDINQKKFQAVGKSVSDIGKKMSTRLTAPVVAFGALSIRTMTQFQDSMNQVNAITRSTDEQFKELRKKALELGASTRYSASETADAIKYLGMAGLKTDEILGSIENTLKLATAGNLDLASAADIATNVMSSMSLGVEELNRVNNALAITATSTNTNVVELSEAMKTSAGFADAMGIDVETLTAALGKMASAGDKASIAGTLFRNSLIALGKGGEKIETLMSALGTKTKDFVTESGKIQNLDVLVDKMSEFMDKGGNALLIQEAFGDRGGRAMINLAKKGKKSFGDLIKDFKSVGNVTDEMAEKMEKGLPGAIRSLKSAFEGLQLKIGDSGFGGAMESAIKKLTGFIRYISDASPEMTAFVTILIGVGAALGPVLIGIGQFVTFAPGMIKAINGIGKAFLFLGKTMFKVASFLMANPILLAIAAIAGAAYLIIRYWKPISKFFSDLWDDIIDIAVDVGKELYKIFIQPFVDLWDFVTDIFGRIKDGIKSLIGWLPDWAQKKLGFKTTIETGNFDPKKINSMVESKSSTDVTIKVKSEEGTTATVDKVKSKGTNKPRVETDSFLGGFAGAYQ